MLELLETGRALYVLAGICLLGIFTRLMTKNLYKRLLKECANLSAAKNKGLKELKRRAEDTYRMNQGLRDSGAWLEHQLCELRFRGMTLNGWGNLSMQLTWLCLLAGGAGAFAAYWYRLDTFYIVMYGGGAVLLSMLMMFFDSGAVGGRREQLTAALQDYLENVLCPRLARNLPLEDSENENESVRSKGRVFGRQSNAGRGNILERDNGNERGGSAERAAGAVRSEFAERTQETAERTAQADGDGTPQRGVFSARSGTRSGAAAESGGNGGNGKRQQARSGRRETAAAAAENVQNPEGIRDIDYLKRSLEQIAASRERNRGVNENWLKELSPEEVKLIGDILKEYLV